ncbi:MAG: hypothetical protein ACOYMF_05385 [Bacteroidales bacterium]
MDYNRLKEIASEKNVKINTIVSELKMSFAGFTRAFRNETLEIRKLIQLSVLLGVSISTWFEETTDTKGLVAPNTSDLPSNYVSLDSSNFLPRKIYEDMKKEIDFKNNQIDHLQRIIESKLLSPS